MGQVTIISSLVPDKWLENKFGECTFYTFCNTTVKDNIVFQNLLTIWQAGHVNFEEQWVGVIHLKYFIAQSYILYNTPF